jgi:hypothetical protein
MKLQGTTFYEPRRPQEHGWRDQSEPNATALEMLWSQWLGTHPEGGELPLEDWSDQLACSREALARALGKLAQGHCTLLRKLEARPLS